MNAINYIPSEAYEQTKFVHWLEDQGYMFTAIPNSTYTTSWNQKRKNRATGLRPGLPDVLVIAENKLMFVEMKRIKNSSTTKEQKKWIEAINAAGIPAKVCKGHEEAIEFIKESTR